MIIHDLDAAVADLHPPVAVDTEFHAAHRYRPKLLLIQLCDARGQTRVVDPSEHEDLTALGAALSDLPLLIHAPLQDLPLLARTADLRPGPVTDPQVLAGFCGLGYPRALGDLVREVLGKELPAGMSLTNWSRRPLTPEQLSYAVADVEHLHELTSALLARIAPALRPLAMEACQELASQSLTLPDPERAWRSIAAARILDATGRDLLRRLAAWRELSARELNQPVRQVASDAALIDLSRRRPTTVEAMASNRKFPRRLVKHHSDLLLEFIAQAQPASDGWPDDHAGRVRLAAINAWLEAWAIAQELNQGIAARLALPAEARQELALSWYRGLPNPLSGWRSQMIPAMSRLVIGSHSIEIPDKS